VFVALALAATPSPCAAQKDPFFDALLRLYDALAGTYGDEGPQLTASVESMSAALAAWDSSIRNAETALRDRLRSADPQNSIQAHTLLASMYSERSRFADALREFDEDIRLDPRRAAFHRFKALASLELNRRSAAAAAFHAAWLADPADPRNAYALVVQKSADTSAAEKARAHDTLEALERSLIRGERSKAEAPFISLRAIDDDARGTMAFAPAAYVRAISLLLNGQLDTGIAALRNAVSMDPLVADPAMRQEQLIRGVAALRQGQLRQAIESMKSARALAPDSSEVHRILATAEIVNGNVTDGVQHLRDAVRLNPKNERAWLALGRTLDEIDEPTQAAEVLHRAAAELPDAGQVRWQLSVISGKRQRTDAADVDLISRADRLVMFAGNSEFYLRIGKLAQAHLDYGRAMALFEHAVRITPNNASAHQLLGRAYVDQGRDEEGYAELVVALWLEPSNAETLTSLGRLHLTLGEYQPAIDALAHAVSVEPGNAQAAHALHESLMRAGRTREAEQLLGEAERLQARAVEAQRRLRTLGMLSLQAEVRMAQRDYDGAIEVWQQATALEGRSVSAHVRLADALIAANRLDPAAAELQAAIGLNAGTDIHRRLADVFAALGRNEDSARERGIYIEQRLQQLRQQSQQ